MAAAPSDRRPSWSMVQAARSASSRVTPYRAMTPRFWLAIASTRPARSRRRTQRAILVQTPQVPSNRRMRSGSLMRASSLRSRRERSGEPLLAASVREGGLQEQRSKRRQREGEAGPVPVDADRDGLRAAEVALPAAPVERRVAVQQLEPPSRLRDAHLVVVTRHGREVEHAHQDVLRRAYFANQADHALVRVGGIDP